MARDRSKKRMGRVFDPGPYPKGGRGYPRPIQLDKDTDKDLLDILDGDGDGDTDADTLQFRAEVNAARRAMYADPDRTKAAALARHIQRNEQRRATAEQRRERDRELGFSDYSIEAELEAAEDRDWQGVLAFFETLADWALKGAILLAFGLGALIYAGVVSVPV